MRSLAATFVFASVCLSAAFSVGCSAPADGTNETTEQDHNANATETASTTGASSAQSALSCTIAGRFTMTPDVTTDVRTNLQWERRPDQTRRTQDGAAVYCAERGWRLPTAPEMTTLRVGPAISGDDTACIPSIDQSAFPDTPAYGFWTASITPNEDAGPGAPDGLYMDFNDGRTHPANPSDELLVRCVADVAQ